VKDRGKEPCSLLFPLRRAIYLAARLSAPLSGFFGLPDDNLPATELKPLSDHGAAAKYILKLKLTINFNFQNKTERISGESATLPAAAFVHTL